MVHFYNNKAHETYWCFSSIAYQDKKTDWILRIFTFNDKNPFLLSPYNFDTSFFLRIT